MDLVNSNTHGIITIKNKSIPFTRYDIGWVVLCIGMAIGSGIVFFPIQVGIKGVWVFALSVIVGYPAVYYLQKLFIQTVVRSDEKDSYISIIASYLGGRWGMVLGVIYLLTMMKSLVEYSMVLTNDSASYLQTFGVTQGLISTHWWWGLTLISILAFIASKGEKLLFKVSGGMVIIKMLIIISIAFIAIPSWNLNNISSIPAMGPLLLDSLLTLPFAIFSILFVQILNPMNLAYKRREENVNIATYKILRVHKVTYTILVIGVLLYVCSITLSISQTEAMSAYKQNISALALAAKVLPGNTIKIMSLILNVFSIVTAFFGIFLTVHEAVFGIIKHPFKKYIKDKSTAEKTISLIAIFVIILILWLFIMSNISIFKIFVFGAPSYGFISCLIPAYLILSQEKLKDLRGPVTYFVLIIGILMCLSPFVTFLKY
ncbi:MULTISPECIES: transporter [Acinetobacter calcoaceticus/baumannii complex]|uniref:transporter n=1 Tax=Acinetobacter calcoaceticus/baumannii complex TaxID=909768 RepID=UPI0018DC2097|nr:MULTISPECIES: transporter [Acinetobacter calcoaceticus/baumannii complex]MDO7209488.1 hypothetical protein [Acinetobacter nosocomialis]MDO7435649.1 hypothetical protein [Acinetobacter nosocomialis]QPV60847.1 transporter [Acinetobacter seifertii]